MSAQNINNRLKSEGLFQSRFTRNNNRRSYIKTDFIIAKNNSRINRIWEYPDDKDIIQMSSSLWEMEEEKSHDPVSLDIDGQIEQSHLSTHKSKTTDISKKDSENSNHKMNKDKTGIRIPEPVNVYDNTLSEHEVNKLAKSSPGIYVY